jgi:hypothetical protein
MEYAARHPDLFVAAEAFSGAVDRNNPTERADEEPTEAQPSSGYGEWLTNQIYYHGHNPVDLAENLRGLALALRTGNGLPGGPCPNCTAPDTVEYTVHQENIALHDQLNTLGIAHTWDDYGPGSHAWYYWQRDLTEAMPDFMRVFAHPPAPPVPFDYKSVDPSYSVYGWNVAIKRPDREFSELRGAGPTAFTIVGSGTATATTARYFKPGATIRVSIQTVQGNTETVTRADSQGRITVTVPIGPTNTYDEYSPQAEALDAANSAQMLGSYYVAGSPGTAVYTAHVKFGSESVQTSPRGGAERSSSLR